MKSRMKIEKPGDVEVTLSITMRASEWEELRDQLSTRPPSWRISAAINDLLAQVRKILWHDDPGPDAINQNARAEVTDG